MPNRIARDVPVQPYAAPAPQLPTGLIDVPRDTGDEFATVSWHAERLARHLSSIADDAARLEGDRAGKVAGTDPNFRPSGDTSIYGAAYEKAATTSYLDTLDAQTRSDMQDVYEKHKNDPNGLTTALTQMHADYSAKHTFPEIQGQFDAGFTRLATAYRRQALSNADTDAKDNLKASLLANINSVDTTTQRLIAATDPNDPGVEDAVRSGIARKEGMYRSAATGDVISQAAAEIAVEKTRRDDLATLYLARAQKLPDAQSVKEFSDNFSKDYAAGKVKGLDGDGYQSLQDSLSTLQKRKLTEGKAQSAALGNQLDDYVARAASGQTPPPGEWNTLLTAAKATPNGDQLVTLAQGKLTLASRLNGLPVDDADAVMRQLRQKWRDEGGIDTQKGLLLDFGDKYVKDQRQALATDQLGTAQAKGTIAAITPLEFDKIGAQPDAATADALAGQVSARVAQAKAVASTLDRQPQFLRPEEKARLSDIVKQGGAPALTLASAIVKGAGPDAPAVLAQIGGEAPVLAQAGVILANGGSLQAARDAVNFAQLKHISNADIPKVDQTTQLAADKSVLGQAYLLTPGDNVRVKQTAEAIARTRIAQEGLDPKSDLSRVKDIYTRALQEASGAVFIDDKQYGGVTNYKAPGWYFGNAQALVPPGVRADKFGEVIGALTDKDLAGLANPPTLGDKPYRADDLKNMIPVATRNGYAFASKSYMAGGTMSFATDKTGKPWVLDWNEIEPTLRSRMPQAFLGH